MFKKIMIMGLFTFINSVNIIASEEQKSKTEADSVGSQKGRRVIWHEEIAKKNDMEDVKGGNNPAWNGNLKFTSKMSVAEIIAMRQKAQAAAASASAQKDKKVN